MSMGPSCSLPQHLASGGHAVNRSLVLPDGEAWHYFGLGVAHFGDGRDHIPVLCLADPICLSGFPLPLSSSLASFPSSGGWTPSLVL